MDELKEAVERYIRAERILAAKRRDLAVANRWLEAHRRYLRENGIDATARILQILDEIDEEE